MNLVLEAKKQFDLEIKTDELLSRHTTLRIGGPADYFIEVDKQKDLIAIYKLALANNIPIFILGGGSNILVGDKGIRGLVIKNMVSEFEILHDKQVEIRNTNLARKEETLWNKNLLDWRDLKYDESSGDGVVVRASSGMILGNLITQTLDRGITGLQWFARIPGTVGGAVWNNIHGAHKLIGDYLESVEYLDNTDLQIHHANHSQLALKYNQSFFHARDKLILSANFNLLYGDKDLAIHTFKEWIKRKSMQPYNSAGCTFSNIDPADKEKYKLENLSTAFIIDNILKLKGYTVGDAQVSNDHSAFIVNNGNATAKDVLEIIETIKQKAKEKIGVDLKEEIYLAGEF